jgi:hypothetical protein
MSRAWIPTGPFPTSVKRRGTFVTLREIVPLASPRNKGRRT